MLDTHTRKPSKCIEDKDELDVDEQAHPGLCGTFEKPRMLSAPHQPPNPVEEFAQIPSLPVTAPELELVKFELASKLVEQLNPSFIIAPLHLFLSDQISV